MLTRCRKGGRGPEGNGNGQHKNPQETGRGDNNIALLGCRETN